MALFCIFTNQKKFSQIPNKVLINPDLTSLTIVVFIQDLNLCDEHPKNAVKWPFMPIPLIHELESNFSVVSRVLSKKYLQNWYKSSKLMLYVPAPDEIMNWVFHEQSREMLMLQPDGPLGVLCACAKLFCNIYHLFC